MSLFKTREWWSTSVGEAEEFDHGCLCVANIDNEVNGSGEKCDACAFVCSSQVTVMLELACSIRYRYAVESTVNNYLITSQLPPPNRHLSEGEKATRKEYRRVL